MQTFARPDERHHHHHLRPPRTSTRGRGFRGADTPSRAARRLIGPRLAWREDEMNDLERTITEAFELSQLRALVCHCWWDIRGTSGVQRHLRGELDRLSELLAHEIEHRVGAAKMTAVPERPAGYLLDALYSMANGNLYTEYLYEPRRGRAIMRLVRINCSRWIDAREG
jgi:hypothetical protein